MGEFKVRKIGFIAGILIMLILLVMPTPEGLSAIGQKVLAVSALMIVFWMTEAISIPATALLPILLFPLVGITGAKGQNDISLFKGYAYQTVYLILGVGFLATAMVKWGLHRRISLWIVMKVGKKPKNIVLGFILGTALISMWMSNTTATAMMLPVAMSIIATMKDQISGGFKKAMVLSIPYAATLGGLGSLIGTTTTPTGTSIIAETIGVQIGFNDWFLIGLPFMIVMLPLAWVWMVKFYKVDKLDEINVDVIKKEYAALGPMNKGEKITSAIFVFAILAWVTSGLWKKYIPFATDETIAMAIAALFLIIPIDFKKGEYVLSGKEAFEDAPWTTMILLGGSMVMGNAITDAGVAQWVAGGLGGLAGMSPLLIIMTVGIVIAFITEVTTNAVVVASFLPVLPGVAAAVGMDPLQLMLVAMVASNFAFMLPPGTPPNAIAYSTGAFEIPDLMKAGFGLKIISLIVFPIILTFLTFGVFGIGM